MIFGPNALATTDIENILVGLRHEAVIARKRVENARRWRECALGYRGRLLENDFRDLPRWRSRYESPLLTEVVERYVPVLTDSKPRTDVVGEEHLGPHDAMMARNVSQGLAREWDEENMQLITPALLRDVCIYGTGHAYVRVVEDEFGGFKIATEIPSPWMIFPAPNASFDKTPDYLWCRHRVSESQLFELLPDLAPVIVRDQRPSSVADEFFEDEEQVIRDNEFLITLSGTSAQIAAGMGNTDVSHPRGNAEFREPKWDLWVGYFHDGTMIEREMQLEDGSYELVPTKKYPYGRIIMLVGNKYYPELDTENRLPHRRCPILRVGCKDIRGSWWGRSVIEPLIDDAKKISMIDNRIMDCIALTLNPVCVVDDNSKVDPETLYTYPGLVIPKTPGSTVEFRPPPPLPSYVFEMRRNLIQQFDKTAGITDISRGNIPTLEDVSGRALEMATEPTYTVIRGIQRNFEKFVTEWGKIVTPLLLRRPEAWWRRLLGEQVDPATGMLLPLGWENYSDEDVANLPDIRMTTGSSLPQNKQAKFSESLQLYQAGVYGAPGSPGASGQVLKDIEHPEADNIVARIMADAQAMAAMQPPPGSIPGQPPGIVTEPNQGLGAPPPMERFEPQMEVA